MAERLRHAHHRLHAAPALSLTRAMYGHDFTERVKRVACALAPSHGVKRAWRIHRALISPQTDTLGSAR
jgi:hypothetical protein